MPPLASTTTTMWEELCTRAWNRAAEERTRAARCTVDRWTVSDTASMAASSASRMTIALPPPHSPQPVPASSPCRPHSVRSVRSPGHIARITCIAQLYLIEATLEYRQACGASQHEPGEHAEDAPCSGRRGTDDAGEVGPGQLAVFGAAAAGSGGSAGSGRSVAAAARADRDRCRRLVRSLVTSPTGRRQ